MNARVSLSRAAFVAFWFSGVVTTVRSKGHLPYTAPSLHVYRRASL